MKLKDVIFSRHNENKHREFSFTVKVKEMDITLEQKEAIREAVREGKSFDLEWIDGEDSTKPTANTETGEIKNMSF